MFVDIVGLLLTVLIVSPRYWLIVLFIGFAELIFNILLSMTLELNITQVIAGGIFTSITGSSSNRFQILSPLFFLLIGWGLCENKRIPLLNLINPMAYFKKPWPSLLIKTAIFRLLIVFLINGK